MAHKMTLLEMVQSIMISMDSDSVNSINDVDESLQIAQTIKDIYYDIIAKRDWEHLKCVQQLEQVGDTAQPTKLKVPDNVYRVDKIQYNKKRSSDAAAQLIDLIYLAPEDFLDMSASRLSTDSTVTTTTMDNSTPLYIANDVMPTYFTSFDDEFIYLDSYYSTDESTVQASKTIVYGIREAVWTVSDSFIPDLPAMQFPMLLETARKTCSKRFRQVVDDEAEKSSIKQYNQLRKRQFRLDGGAKFYNYGRRK